MTRVSPSRYLPAVIMALVILSACGGLLSGDGGAASGEPPEDFAFVPYQSIGNPDLPEDEAEMMFSEVFDEGAPVVLNFWAGQCPPCRAEMPHFQQLADEYSGEFVLIGIDVGPFTGLGTHDDALALLEELDVSYPAGRALERDPLIDYNATGMPTTVFFSADGEVVHTQIGMIPEDQMRQRIEELI